MRGQQFRNPKRSSVQILPTLSPQRDGHAFRARAIQSPPLSDAGRGTVSWPHLSSAVLMSSAIAGISLHLDGEYRKVILQALVGTPGYDLLFQQLDAFFKSYRLILDQEIEESLLAEVFSCRVHRFD